MKKWIIYAMAWVLALPAIVGFLDIWIWIFIDRQLSPIVWGEWKVVISTAGFILSGPVFGLASEY